MAIRRADGTIEYEGAVLSLREMNGYNDSDFYATVYDAEANEVREVEYGTTRFGGSGSAAVDATAEVIEAAVAAELARRAPLVREELESAARAIERDGRVYFLRDYNARKAGVRVAKGTEGTVFWYGEDKFRYGAYRAGVELATGERVFLDTAVLAAAAVEVDEAEVAEALARTERNLLYRWTGSYTREETAA